MHVLVSSYFCRSRHFYIIFVPPSLWQLLHIRGKVYQWTYCIHEKTVLWGILTEFRPLYYRKLHVYNLELSQDVLEYSKLGAFRCHKYVWIKIICTTLSSFHDLIFILSLNLSKSPNVAVMNHFHFEMNVIAVDIPSSSSAYLRLTTDIFNSGQINFRNLWTTLDKAWVIVCTIHVHVHV